MTRPLRPRIPLALLAAGLVALTACTDPSAFASPSGLAEANPTPRRTQAVPSRPAPTPPPTPSPLPSIAIATPLPHSDLEKLLPDFSADGQSLSKRTATAEDLSKTETGRFVDGLLAGLGRPRSAVEMAVASGSWLGFTAIRVDGVAGDELEDAAVQALFGIHPGSETTSDVGGRPVRWLTFEDDGPFPVDDARVFSDGDVVFIVTASKDHEAVALETLTSMLEPQLEEVLPASLDGRLLVRFSAPAAAFDTGGDTCSLICPAEVGNLAKALGVTVADMDVAGAYSQEPPGLVVLVFRIPGQKPNRLVDGRVQASGRADEPWVVPTKVSVGGKTVTWVNYSLFDNDYEREYLYATDGLLFSIRPAPADGKTATPSVEAAIAGLP
jgi:hypothetical protein